MKYQVIEARSVKQLEERINDVIKNHHGTPIGGELLLFPSETLLQPSSKQF